MTYFDQQIDPIIRGIEARPGTKLNPYIKIGGIYGASTNCMDITVEQLKRIKDILNEGAEQLA